MNVFETQFGPNRYRISIETGQYVTVERFENGGLVSIKRFMLGDMAEYDSYNLSYYGPITAISAKTITIKTTSGKARRLRPDTFAWRNWNFEAAKASKSNNETMQFI